MRRKAMILLAIAALLALATTPYAFAAGELVFDAGEAQTNVDIAGIQVPVAVTATVTTAPPYRPLRPITVHIEVAFTLDEATRTGLGFAADQYLLEGKTVELRHATTNQLLATGTLTKKTVSGDQNVGQVDLTYTPVKAGALALKAVLPPTTVDAP